jgi:hypothetical protein
VAWELFSGVVVVTKRRMVVAWTVSCRWSLVCGLEGRVNASSSGFEGVGCTPFVIG